MTLAMPRNPKSAAKLAGMPTKIPARTLATVRLVSLLRHRVKDTGLPQTKVAAELGIDPSLPSKLFRNQFRNVDAQTIDVVVETLGIERRFFTDESLGQNPDYKPYLTGRKAQLHTWPQSTPQAAVEQPDSTLPADAMDALEMLNATAEERAALVDILDHYRFPYINKALVLGIVSGMRKGRRLYQRIDDALAASIEEEARRRRPDK